MTNPKGADAFPSFPGGSAAKVADLFERAWTARSLLDLVSGEIAELRLEQRGPQGIGVEFCRILPNGGREYHSVKRQAPHSSGVWTVPEITRPFTQSGRSILGDLFGHLETDPTAISVFVSQDGVRHLREIAERARSSSDCHAFYGSLASEHKRALDAYLLPICKGKDGVYECMVRCEFSTIDHYQLVKVVEERIQSLISRLHGQGVDATQIRLLLEGFAWSRLGQAIRDSDVESVLQEHGYGIRLPANRKAMLRQICDRALAFAKFKERSLINGASIPRTQANEIVESAISEPRTAILTGGAGAGKSCTLAQVIRQFIQREIHCIAFSAADLRGLFSLVELGQRMGMQDSPAIELAKFANGGIAAICVDQLDVLADEIDGIGSGSPLLHELVNQVAGLPNVVLILACRSFDLLEGPGLKWLAESDSSVSRTFEIVELSVDEVLASLTSADINYVELSEPQIEMLRTPLHLYLFIEAAQSREMGFATIDDLFDAYWEEKQSRIVMQPALSSSSWIDPISKLCRLLSDLETHSANQIAISDAHPVEANALASESVFLLNDGELSFFHESFFYYAFARCFVNENRGLVDWLVEGTQSFFRRSQIAAILAFGRRNSEHAKYLASLERLLGSDDIRFHIKQRALRWLRDLSNPTAEEWALLESVMPSIGSHIWSVPWNSVPWFDTLVDMRRWDSWLKGNVEPAIRLLQSPKVLSQRAKSVIDVLVRHRSNSIEWWDHAWGVALAGSSTNSSEIHDWTLELIEGEPLDSLDAIDRRARWVTTALMHLEGVAPNFGPKVVAAWFDRERNRLVQVRSNNPIGSEFKLRLDYWAISEVAKSTPAEFAAELFPRLASVEQEIPTRLVGKTADDVRRADLYELVNWAMPRLARDDVGAFKSTVELVTVRGDEWTRWMCTVVLDAMSANPEAFADELAEFLLVDPRCRLDLSYAYSTVGGDLELAISRTAVAASSSHCSASVFAELEKAILEFNRSQGESNPTSEKKQLALLWCLPSEKMSEIALSRTTELEAQFPDFTRRGSPQFGDGQHRFEWAASPIPIKDALTTPNERWIELMRSTGDSEKFTDDGSFIGGSLELSRSLEQATRRDPKRFSGLTNELDATVKPIYFEAILRGLTNDEGGSERAGLPDHVIPVLRKIGELRVEVSGQAIAHAIGSLADSQISDEFVEWLCQIAMEDPDPVADDWILPNGELAAISQAINSARGVAAGAIARLLIANPDRWIKVHEAVKQLANDPVLAVRSTAVRCLNAIFESNQDTAIALFFQLIRDAESIIDSAYVKHFLARATRFDYPNMRGTLQRLLKSSVNPAVRVAAQLTVSASMMLRNAEVHEDELQVLAMGEYARAGAADVYASNVAREGLGSHCASQLTKLFSDTSRLVRSAAAKCWVAIGVDQFGDHADLIRAYAHSLAFDSHLTGYLLHRLAESDRSIPAEVCDLAEGALATYGEKATSIQYAEAGNAREIGILLLRLHDENSDSDVKKRAQDCIDRMIKSNFFGVLEELERRTAD